jgi:hypothetical protein
MRNAYKILVGKPEGKRPLGRPGRRWEFDIRMDLREIGYITPALNLVKSFQSWYSLFHFKGHSTKEHN